MPSTCGKLPGSSATINRDADAAPRPSRVPLESDGNYRRLQLGGKTRSACKLNVASAALRTVGFVGRMTGKGRHRPLGYSRVEARRTESQLVCATCALI